MKGHMKTIVLDALIITALSAITALVVNSVRTEGLPLVASEEYELFVPCPEPLGEVEAVDPGDPLVTGRRTVLIDARTLAEYERWHFEGARNMEFDYILPVSDDAVRELAASGAATIVVYGDGMDPDSGHEMARELAGRGLRNVHYVKGGAQALRPDNEE